MKFKELFDPRTLKQICWFLCRPFTNLMLKLHGVEYNNSKTYGFPIISNQGKIKLGKNVDLFSTNAYYVTASLVPQCLLKTYPGGCITVGDNVKLHGTTIISSASVTIGANTMFGANCLILDTDIHPICPNHRTEVCSDKVACKPVLIGKNVFIGINVIILKGVKIGDNAVIGAGSVVSSDVAPNSIVAGNPARFLRCM